MMLLYYQQIYHQYEHSTTHFIVHCFGHRFILRNVNGALKSMFNKINKKNVI